MMHIPMTIVQPFAQPAEPQNTSMDKLRIMMAVELASDATGVPKADIMGQSRVAHIARARHLAYAKAREYGVSFAAIGRGFGRDHTTVMHGVRKVGGAL